MMCCAMLSYGVLYYVVCVGVWSCVMLCCGIVCYGMSCYVRVWCVKFCYDMLCYCVACHVKLCCVVWSMKCICCYSNTYIYIYIVMSYAWMSWIHYWLNALIVLRYCQLMVASVALMIWWLCVVLSYVAAFITGLYSVYTPNSCGWLNTPPSNGLTHAQNYKQTTKTIS
jgi:hypothetical protein